MKIEINTDVLTRLRDIINEKQNISYNKEFLMSLRKGKTEKFCAWDKICAIMDRLDDTAWYLNELELNTGKYRKSAFDFYDFMNNASVIVDCIKELAKIFEVDTTDIEKTSNIFNQLGSTGKGTDKKYFEYIRSLCAVHPSETSRHVIYQENTFECSPYVVWCESNRILINKDYDLYAKVYTSKKNDWGKNIPIYLSQIFEYVNSRVEFISKIVDGIEKYHNDVIEYFRHKPIKKKEEFKSYVDYLRNLEKETKSRSGDEVGYSFEYVINLLELKLSNSENIRKIELYINALKYSIEFQHNSLQNMSEEGFENHGLKHLKENFETTLYYELNSLNSDSDEVRNYRYNIEKISYLSYDSGSSNKQWAYGQIEQAKDFFERYVTFEGESGDFEYYALCHLALYLECLENDCLINKNIPNEVKYRETLLSNDEISNLTKDKEKNNKSISADSLLELIDRYRES